MDKKQAETWVKEITELLQGKNLVSVAAGPGSRVEIRQNQKFDKSYFVEHKDGSCVVALCDTYGVMTGAETWSIDPDRRTIHAETTNGFGEPVRFAWAIADNDDDGKMFFAMRDAQERMWAVR